MATNVQFKQLQCHDDRPIYDKETAMRRIMNFAGVHDITSAAEILYAGNASGWADAEGTWTIGATELVGIGGGAEQWYKIRCTTPVEGGFRATFDKAGDNGAFLFNSTDGYDGYLAWWTGVRVGVSVIEGDTETILTSLPCEVETSVASVTVGIEPKSHTRIDQVDDLAISLYFDDRLLLCFSLAYEEKGNYIGFAVYGDNTATFSSLRVSQAHHIKEWASVDPGEVASAGLGRVVGYDNIHIRARYDGSVHIWIPDEVPETDWQIPDRRILRLMVERQVYWPNHLRLVGALHEGESFRDGEQGHIFAIANDPDALTEAETQDKAERRHLRVEAQSRRASVVLHPNPVIEAGDAVEIDGEVWRVVSYDYQATWKQTGGAEAPVLVSSMELEQCPDA